MTFHIPDQATARNQLTVPRVTALARPGPSVSLVDVAMRDADLVTKVMQRVDFGPTPIAERRLTVADAQAVLSADEARAIQAIAAGNDGARDYRRRAELLARGIYAVAALAGAAVCLSPLPGDWKAVALVMGGGFVMAGVRIMLDNARSRAYGKRDAIEQRVNVPAPVVPAIAWQPPEQPRR